MKFLLPGEIPGGRVCVGLREEVEVEVEAVVIRDDEDVELIIVEEELLEIDILDTLAVEIFETEIVAEDEDVVTAT